MTYGFPLPVGFGAGLIIVNSTSQSEMQNDTDSIMGVWGETLTVKRKSSTWSNGRATVTWGDITTFQGDWQPVSGSVVREEEGIQVRSQAMILCQQGYDIEEDDRIYRSDNTFMYVNYIKRYANHWTLLLTRNEPVS